MWVFFVFKRKMHETRVLSRDNRFFETLLAQSRLVAVAAGASR